MPRPRYFNYPPPVEAPANASQLAYTKPKAHNPVIGGLTLQVLSNLVVRLGFVQRFLWSNADFGSLKKIKVLENYVPCFDPCVVPLEGDPEQSPDFDSIDTPVDTAYYSSADYVKAYLEKKTTPEAVAKRLFEILKEDPHATAIIQVCEDITLEKAKASWERYLSGTTLGPLDGVPIVVKDETDVKGYQKTFGSKKIWDYGEGETAWSVKKLEDAGAIIIAKTSMHELGSDTTNNNPVRGTPRNPYNRKYYTGGSSGGSGYCVGAGLVPIAVGADGGGSIRVPASYCGAYGLKPSHGRLSARPAVDLSHSNGVIGPIAGTIDDLKLAYRVMAEPDPLDQWSAAFPEQRSLSAGLTLPKKKIVGIYKEWFDDCSPVVNSHTTAAIQALEKNGWEVKYLDPIPFLSEARQSHGLSIITDMGTFCAGDYSELNAANKVLFSVGAQTPVADLFAANKVRSMMMSHFASIYTKYPGIIIATPVTPEAGAEINEAHLKYGVSDGDSSIRSMKYVFIANFLGLPATNAIVGYDDHCKLPVSLMGTAEWGREEDLLGFLADATHATGVKRQRAESWVDVLGTV